MRIGVSAPTFYTITITILYYLNTSVNIIEKLNLKWKLYTHSKFISNIDFIKQYSLTKKIFYDVFCEFVDRFHKAILSYPIIKDASSWPSPHFSIDSFWKGVKIYRFSKLLFHLFLLREYQTLRIFCSVKKKFCKM